MKTIQFNCLLFLLVVLKESGTLGWNDDAPIYAESITTEGRVENSKRYSGGKNGNKRATVEVDDNNARIDLLEKKDKKLNRKFKKLMIEVEKLQTLNNNTQVPVNENKDRIISLENDTRTFNENLEKVKENFEQVIEQIKEQVKDNFEQVKEEVKEQVKDSFEQVKEQAKENFEQVKEQQFIEIFEQVKEEIEKGDQKLQEQFEEIKDQYRKLKDQEENRDITSRTAKGCEEWNTHTSGIRNISLITSPIQLYCDQDTDGGKWNVFQRRQDGSVDFYRGWSDYRNGFGDLDNEFWLGLETVHQMTSDGRKYELRFDFEKQDGTKYFAVYDDFSIWSESEGYAVHFTSYKGNAGDSFTYHNRMKFSTKDRDQDAWGDNCAKTFSEGAWWYVSCAVSNLNGLYNDTRDGKGVMWHKLTGHEGSLKKTEMKFRVKK